MDQSFACYGEVLCLLVDLPEKGSNLPAAFEKNIKNVCGKLSIDDFSDLPTLKKFGVKVDENNDVRWKWVSLALHIFLSLKEKGQGNEPLLTVRQEKGVKSCLEFIISMGILPSLIPGVGIPLSKRCSTAAVQWIIQGDQDKGDVQISMIELHERLSAVTKVLLACIKADFFRGLILNKHLCDILAALCQLSMAPLKKPLSHEGVVKENVDVVGHQSKESKSEDDENACSNIFSKKRLPAKKSVLVSEVSVGKDVNDVFRKKNEDFKMTPELWNYLQMEREFFSKILNDLVCDTYQPLVIRDLILLLGSPDKSAEKGKPAPMWLRKGCSNLLNSCLFRKDGVVATVRAICDAYSVPKSSCDNWAQHVILGKLFVMAVKSKKGDAMCCQSICSQVIELLSVDNLKASNEFARAGLACVSMLWDEEEGICRSYILKCIFPFTNEDRQGQKKVVCQLTDNSRCADDQIKGYDCNIRESKWNSGKQACIQDSELDSSLELIHYCFVENDPGMSLPSRLLAPVFPILLRKFHCVETEVSIKSIIKSVLIKFLVSCGDESLLSQTLNSVLFEGSCSSAGIEKLAHENDHLKTEDGTQDLQEKEEDLLKEILERHLRTETLGKPVEEKDGEFELGWGSVPLLDIVSCDGGGEAAEILFRYILKVFPKVGEKSSLCQQSEWLLCIAKQSVAIKILCHLLEVPAVSEQVRKRPVDVVNFLGNFLAAEAGKVFGKNAAFQITEEAVALIDRSHTQTDDSLLNVSGESSFPSFLNFSTEETKNQIPEEEVRNESEEESHSEFVLVALLILKSLCEAGLSESEENWWNPLRSILPQIRAFRRESSCPEVRAMAEDIACAILKKEKVGESTGPFSERGGNISKVRNQKNVHPDHQGSSDQRQAGSEESQFEAALKLAHETAVHLRGHGLISLSKLIKSKDAVALRHKSTLLEIFQANLKHDDSYIYLAAINGLEQLGNMFPDQVLESLADEYAEIGIVKAGDADFNNVRLKVGEALLKVTRTLGEMIPKYSTLLLNAFLGGVRDADGFVRASSLSNLGEVCKLLSFRIGSIITEILWCVRCVLETDVVVEARRAAVLVITLLLQGMGVEIFKVLETVLPELYRALKSVRDNDSDEIVKVHAQMALEEVNRITKEFLFPQQKLQKKIFVLDAPS